ncbi:MAG TPA: hypothetical protein VHX60_01625 [Acidobacteriaceae bacterium]|jgi:hypothetical protein|nr:hypothetical protein [Acidobacteriaceae bacterium]
MNNPSETPNPPISTPPKGLHLLQTGFLIAGSALLGGLAVAFWNRKSLAKLRQPVTPPATPEDAETE